LTIWADLITIKSLKNLTGFGTVISVFLCKICFKQNCLLFWCRESVRTRESVKDLRAPGEQAFLFGGLQMSNTANTIRVWDVLEQLDNQLRPARDKLKLARNMIIDGEVLEDSRDGLVRIMTDGILAFDNMYREISGRRNTDIDMPLPEPEPVPEQTAQAELDKTAIRKQLHDKMGTEIAQLRIIREALPAFEIEPKETKAFEDPLRIQNEIQRIVGNVILAFDRWNSDLYPDDYEGED